MFRLTKKKRSLKVDNFHFQIARSTAGVIELWADNDIAMAVGTGFGHAHDRMTQLMLTRIIGQGRISEFLESTPQSLETDRFMREMGFARDAKRDALTLDSEIKAFADAYCLGINTYLRKHGRPFSLKLAGYRPTNWLPEDILLTIKLMSYLGLAQSQNTIEKYIIQALQQNTPPEPLKRLFAPHLDQMTDETIAHIKKYRLPIRPSL